LERDQLTEKEKEESRRYAKDEFTAQELVWIIRSETARNRRERLP